jgi:hypothetical protein
MAADFSNCTFGHGNLVVWVRQGRLLNRGIPLPLKALALQL